MRTIILAYVSFLVLMVGVSVSMEWVLHRNVNSQWRFAQHQAMIHTVSKRFGVEEANEYFYRILKENYPRFHVKSDIKTWKTYPNKLHACVQDRIYGVWVKRCRAMSEVLDEF